MGLRVLKAQRNLYSRQANIIQDRNFCNICHTICFLTAHRAVLGLIPVVYKELAWSLMDIQITAMDLGLENGLILKS